MLPDPTDPSTPSDPTADLGGLLVRHLDTLRCFVRIHVSPELRQREQDSDIVQSVCAEVIANAGRFQWQGEAAFRSWLYRAVLDRVRHKLRFHRAERRNASVEVSANRTDADVLDSYADLVTPSRVAMSRELQQQLELAMDDLPDQQREVLVRTRLLQMSHDDTAAELGITPAHSRQLLHRAIAHLALIVAKGG